ncbi:hypothetical protein L9F63_014351 [Diploptera punctata]|uniref:Uncharacterized protein n=1 Tax=Diploptera punctata TaxID=6984 RepID=A0AAD8EL52_DIPPU|nr:hypothetical protein L9F63_014351 [Diploptera punctata]
MDEFESYHKRCRLCASEHCLSIKLFGIEGISLDLQNKIKTYISMDVSPEDELPKQICYQCLYCIETFHNFKQTCIEAEHTLKNWHLFYGGFSTEVNVVERISADETDNSEICVESEPEPTSSSKSTLQKKQNKSCDEEPEVTTVKNSRNVVRIEEDTQGEEENSEVSRILLNMSGVGTISITKYEGIREQEQDGRDKEVDTASEQDIVRSDDEDDAGFSGFDFEQTMSEESEEMKDDMVVGELVPNEYVKFEHLQVDQNGKVTTRENERISTSEELSKYMMVTLDSPSGPRYGCLECNKTFSQKGYVKEHLKIHTGEKPFACSVCGRCFRNNYMLKVHFRLHTGEKNFKCEKCSAKFTERGALVSHFRTHTGVKPFACTHCDRRFTQNPALKRHMRIHTKEKPYSCDECDASFADRGTWKNHIRIHTGERPFKCTLCEKTFIQRTNLQAHIKTHTDERPFPCNVCESTFRTKAHLVKHLSTIHRDVMKSVVNMMKLPLEEKTPDIAINTSTINS